MKRVQVDILDNEGNVIQSNWFNSIAEALDFAGTRSEKVRIGW